MKRFSLILLVVALTMILPARAQDVGLLDERVKQLLGKIENLEEANAGQKKQIEALVKEIQSLREYQQNVPTTGFASTQDLRELTRKVQEIEEKRKSDRTYLEKEFTALKKLAGGKTSSPKNSEGDKPKSPDNSTPLPGKGVEHVIAQGDYISTIALAYSKELGVKITQDMILRANPGLKAERMIVGKKILIPVPDK